MLEEQSSEEMTEISASQAYSPLVRYESVSIIYDVDVSKELESKERRKCSRCGKVFFNEKGLNQHIGKKHNSKKKHVKCQICPKGFRNKYALRFHVKQVHTQATKVTCTLCHLECYNKYALQRHLENQHHFNTRNQQ